MKKGILLFLCILLFVLDSNGQKKFSFYTEISPIYSYRLYAFKEVEIPTWLIATEQDFLNIIRADYDEIESCRFSYGFNFGINYHINNWFQFKTGIGIKNIGEKVEYLAVLEQYEFNGQIISFYSDKTETADNKYIYFSIPFGFQFNLLKRDKWTLGVIIGGDTDFLLRGSLVNEPKKNSLDLKYTVSEFPKLAASLHGGLVAIIKLNEKLDLSISPQFTRYVTPNLSFTLDEYDLYLKVNQYNYYGQLKIGVIFNKKLENN